MLIPIYDFMETAVPFLKDISCKCQLLSYLELHLK